MSQLRIIYRISLMAGVSAATTVGLIAAGVWTGIGAGLASLLIFGSMLLRRERCQEPDVHEELVDNETWKGQLRWIWLTALGCFIIAGATGALFRFGMLNGFPHGLLPENVRHAHSHLMYFSWVTPAVMALIAAGLPSLTGRPLPRRALRSIHLTIGSTFVLGLLAFVPFLLYGYSVAEFGDKRLPVSMIMAGMNVIPWYVFGVIYFRLRRGAPPSQPLRLYDMSLMFLVIASMGAWGIAVFRIIGFSDPFWDRVLIHIFLDLFSDGWLILALLGFMYSAVGQGGADRILFRLATTLFVLGLPAAFILTIPVSLVPPGIRLVASAGGLAAAVGLGLHLYFLWQNSRHALRWRIVLSLLIFKTAVMALIVLPDVGRFVEQTNLRILYLHILLLGFVTLVILYACEQVWEQRHVAGRNLFTLSVIVLLVSLVPLTGLWRETMAGRGLYEMAYWIALLPVAAALRVLVGAFDCGQVLKRASLPRLQAFRELHGGR